MKLYPNSNAAADYRETNLREAWSPEARQAAAAARRGKSSSKRDVGGKAVGGGTTHPSHPEYKADHLSANGHEGFLVGTPRKGSAGYTESTINHPSYGKGYILSHPVHIGNGKGALVRMVGAKGVNGMYIDSYGKTAKSALSNAVSDIKKLQAKGLWNSGTHLRAKTRAENIMRRGNWNTQVGYVLGRRPSYF